MTPLLQVENLHKSFGHKPLFGPVSFTVGAGERVGLIARNGAGKSTLLRIAAGADSPDSGTVTWQNGVRVGYLAQEPDLDPALSVVGNVCRGHAQASAAVESYALAAASGDKNALERASAAMDAHQGWTLENQARQLLTRLGIDNASQPVATLSGGQRKRVALAAVLAGEPDFLILDEPTNHLDIDMVEWLEARLAAAGTSLLMVTHDRVFLDRVCGSILEIDDNTLYRYEGNYSYFLRRRGERLDARQANAERAANLYRRELEWMRRTPSARTGKAKYRIDAFQALRDEPRASAPERGVRIATGAARMGKKVLEVKDLSKAFGNKVILDRFSYNFRRRERLGIIGDNGAGKTTFLNLLTGNLQPDTGTVEAGETIVFGYYRQGGIEAQPGKKVIDVLRDIAECVTLADGKTLSASQFLTLFMFPHAQQNDFVDKLSGGERRRLYLCTVLMRNPNFLILDEPTNDLDIPTMQVLEEYLADFPGVTLVVSHDRHFVDKVVDGLLVFDGGGAVSGFAGGYTDYRQWLRDEQRSQQAAKAAQQSKPAKNAKPDAPRDDRRHARPARLTYAQERELEGLTADIERLEAEKAALEDELNDTALGYEAITAKSARIGEILALLSDKELRWLELMEIKGE